MLRENIEFILTQMIRYQKMFFELGFKLAEKNDYYIKFNVYLGDERLVFHEIYRNIINNKILQPNLSTYVHSLLLFCRVCFFRPA